MLFLWTKRLADAGQARERAGVNDNRVVPLLPPLSLVAEIEALRDRADRAGLGTLSYLLEAALIEARRAEDQRRRHREERDAAPDELWSPRVTQIEPLPLDPVLRLKEARRRLRDLDGPMKGIFGVETMWPERLIAQRPCSSCVGRTSWWSGYGCRASPRLTAENPLSCVSDRSPAVGRKAAGTSLTFP
jgi:hypothetical protein